MCDRRRKTLATSRWILYWQKIECGKKYTIVFRELKQILQHRIALRFYYAACSRAFLNSTQKPIAAQYVAVKLARDERRAIRKSADKNPYCTRHNQITHFTRERVKLELMHVSLLFPLFRFWCFQFSQSRYDSSGNFSSLSKAHFLMALSRYKKK